MRAFPCRRFDGYRSACRVCRAAVDRRNARKFKRGRVLRADHADLADGEFRTEQSNIRVVFADRHFVERVLIVRADRNAVIVLAVEAEGYAFQIECRIDFARNGAFRNGLGCRNDFDGKGQAANARICIRAVRPRRKRRAVHGYRHNFVSARRGYRKRDFIAVCIAFFQTGYDRFSFGILHVQRYGFAFVVRIHSVDKLDAAHGIFGFTPGMRVNAADISRAAACIIAAVAVTDADGAAFADDEQFVCARRRIEADHNFQPFVYDACLHPCVQRNAAGRPPMTPVIRNDLDERAVSAFVQESRDKEVPVGKAEPDAERRGFVGTVSMSVEHFLRSLTLPSTGSAMPPLEVVTFVSSKSVSAAVP